jgi:hypothetical protein
LAEGLLLNSDTGRTRQRRSQSHLIVGLLLLVGVLALSACAGQGSESSASPSPRPAASVAVLPGLSAADRDQDLAAFKEVAARVINVYLDDRTPRAHRSH